LFFTSVNKIALLAFVIVLGFLAYEVHLFRKEKEKSKKPTIPQFTPSQVPAPPAGVVQATVSAPPQSSPVLKKTQDEQPKTLIIIGVLTVLIIGSVFTYFFVTQANQKKVKVQTVPIVQEISSAGLKVFDKNWSEIKNSEKVEAKIKPGDVVYIGIQTIEEADIDRARIRVNKTVWEIKDITTTFNPKLKVYYKEYPVATGTAQLKIDAQLHSASDGWLGE